MLFICLYVEFIPSTDIYDMMSVREVRPFPLEPTEMDRKGKVTLFFSVYARVIQKEYIVE